MGKTKMIVIASVMLLGLSACNGWKQEKVEQEADSTDVAEGVATLDEPLPDTLAADSTTVLADTVPLPQ